jgi:hypothetical protein
MPGTLRVLVADAFAALLLAPAVLRAQASPATAKGAAADSLAFPRQWCASGRARARLPVGGRFIRDPNDVVKVGQKVRVTVVCNDTEAGHDRP